MDWVLAWRHDTLTPISEVLSALGSTTFFLTVFTLGYWLVDRRVFYRVSIVLMITAVFNGLLKGVFQAPRPAESLRLVVAAGWSFPSGHAMIAGAIWPWLARESKRRWTWIASAFVAFGIAASRVYLGVHYPRDVIAGLLLGLGLFLGLWWLADMAPAVWSELRWRQKAALLLVPVVLLLWVLPSSGDGDETVAKAGGSLIGLVLGADLERRRLRFRPPRGWWKLAAGVLGLACVFGLRYGLAAVLGAAGITPTWADAGRYLILGLFLAMGAPWIFVRLGWCRTELQGPSEVGGEVHGGAPAE